MKSVRIGAYVFTLLSWAVFFLVDFLLRAVYDESGKDEVFLKAFGPLSYLWPLALYAALAVSIACAIFALVLAFKKWIRSKTGTGSINKYLEAPTWKSTRIVAYVLALYTLLSWAPFFLLDFLLRADINLAELYGPIDYFRPIALHVAVAVSFICALFVLFLSFEKWLRS